MEPLPDLTSALDHSPRRSVGLSKEETRGGWTLLSGPMGAGFGKTDHVSSQLLAFGLVRNP